LAGATVHEAKNAELEAHVKSQAERIAELEKACAKLWQEKQGMTDGYRQFSAKHKTLVE
jgi:uncharacterized coiled-coil protein SlyX